MVTSLCLHSGACSKSSCYTVQLQRWIRGLGQMKVTKESILINVPYSIRYLLWKKVDEWKYPF